MRKPQNSTRQLGLLVAVTVVHLGCRHRGVDLDGTAPIPGGEFHVGSDLEERSEGIEAIHRAPDEKIAARTEQLRQEPPQRRASVAPFHMMVFPVTTQEYAQFVEDTGAAEPWVTPDALDADAEAIERFMWIDGRPNVARRTHPVVLVTQTEAISYCAWWGVQRGGHGRLPTAEEWERAARGPEGAAYPGGIRPEPEQANLGPGRDGDTQPVHRRPVVTSGFGVADLAGNAAEWTSTLTPTGAVVKGGSWRTGPELARAAAQRVLPPTARRGDVGFRCVFETSRDKRRNRRAQEPAKPAELAER